MELTNIGALQSQIAKMANKIIELEGEQVETKKEIKKENDFVDELSICMNRALKLLGKETIDDYSINELLFIIAKRVCNEAFVKWKIEKTHSWSYEQSLFDFSSFLETYLNQHSLSTIILNVAESHNLSYTVHMSDGREQKFDIIKHVSFNDIKIKVVQDENDS